jgi:hypothetical protein
VVWNPREPPPLVGGSRGDGQAVYGNSLATLVIAFETPADKPREKRTAVVELMTPRTSAYSDIVCPRALWNCSLDFRFSSFNLTISFLSYDLSRTFVRTVVR